MNNPLDTSLRALNDCGCCAGAGAATPVVIHNRPGLSAVVFRAGVHSSFKSSMLAALTAGHRPALAGLKTRDDDDFTIALLDGWAAIADILTFYSERVANESFLRTATEERSVLQLARTLGYELNPGVAASTWLVFTVEDGLGAPGFAFVDRRTKVQSVPGPGEKPQVYETVTPFEARKEWNRLDPLAAKFTVPFIGMRQLRLQGISTGLKPGDALLVVGNERTLDASNGNWDFRRVSAIETFPNPDPAMSYSLVTLDQPLGNTSPSRAPSTQNPTVYTLRLRTGFFGNNAPDWRSMPNSIKAAFGDPLSGTHPALTGGQPIFTEWPDFTLAGISDGPPPEAVGTGLFGEFFNTDDFREFSFSRTDAAIDFDWGTGSPDARINADAFSVRWTGWIRPPGSAEFTFATESDDGVRLYVDGRLLIDNWTVHGRTRNIGTARLEAGRNYDIKLEYFERTGAAVIRLLWSYPGQTEQVIPTANLFPRDIHTLHLEAVHPAILPNGWMVIATPEHQQPYQVLATAEDARSNFTLSAKTTRLQVRGANLREFFNNSVREASVFAQSEELPWALEPIHDAVAGNEITLDTAVPDIPVDRELLLTGASARVEFTGEAPSIVLALKGAGARTLTSGAQLTLLGPGEPQSDGRLRWPARAEDGAEGTVLATPALLRFIPADPEQQLLAETVRVRRIETTLDGLTRILLAESMKHAYDPATLTIFGNVAFATHGETVGQPIEEVLGHGDASQPHQRFFLKEKPLTYIPAANSTGGESTLEIRVNDVKWREVATFFGHGPNEKIYITRRDEEGRVAVRFGDGHHGARLPTGHENIRAIYRKGIGTQGSVKAEQLTLLMTRPLGVKSVFNPKPSGGAANPASRDQSRRDAPMTVLTLDRVVSLSDYEDFARGFQGIAKASATWTWNEHSRGVLLTIAGIGGAEPDDGVRARLLDAIRTRSNPLAPVKVEPYTPAAFRLAGTVRTAQDRDPEKVGKTVHEALKRAFNFDSRSFGQPVARSEVIAVIQNVPGVVSVDLDALFRGTTSELQEYLPAHKPGAGASAESVAPAELLTLDESSLPSLNVEIETS